MKTYEHILVDRVGTDGRVARITLNHPDELNLITPAMVAELDCALHELESDDSARVIVLRGAGRAFSAGWDLGGTDLMASPYAGGSYETETVDGRPLVMNFASGLKRGAEVQLYLWGMAKVTIAQVHGFCVAGGMEFAMMTDLMTASEDCIIGHPGSRGVGVARNAAMLPMAVGMRKAKELLYTGDSVSGSEAADLGMINYAWPAEALDERTIDLADRVANMSADHLAVLKAAALQFYDTGLHSTVAAVTHLDAIAQNTGSAHEWQRLLAEEGLKPALRWRDEPYGDYGFRAR